MPGKYHPVDLLSHPEIIEKCRPLTFTEEKSEFVAAGAGVEIDYLGLELLEVATSKKRSRITKGHQAPLVNN